MLAPPCHEVAPVGALPLRGTATAALYEDGLGDRVAPDDIQGGTVGEDRAGGVIAVGPDDVGVVFDEAVDAEEGAGGGRAEDVDVAAPYADGIAVVGAARGQELDILGKDVFRVGGAKILTFFSLDGAIRMGRLAPVIFLIQWRRSSAAWRAT